MHKNIPVRSSLVQYFAGLMYMINPFLYVRFLVGHWMILLAYAIVPFAFGAFIKMLEERSKKSMIGFLILTSLVTIFSLHIAILLGFLFTVIIFIQFWTLRKNKSDLKSFIKIIALCTIVFFLINLYWILPVFATKTTWVGEITGSDLHIFSARTSAFNTLFTTASMYGFWRGGYIYAKDFIPYWYLLFIFILYLAIIGFISNYRDKKIGVYVKAFAPIAIVAVILGSGIYGPFSSVFEFLFNNIFFFRGLRDSHKFVALLVLSYAYLGALGVAEFEKIARSIGRDKKRILAWAVIILALITPFVYSFTMFNGFWGQIKPTDYPEDWYETNEFLNQDNQDFNVLFFPWHLYMDFHWVPNKDKRIANPASSFFDKPSIQGENIEVGNIYSQSTNPAQRYVESLLVKRSNLTNFGELMIPLNVNYVLLTKEVDYKEYFFLFNQTDLVLKKETDNFYIFENKHAVSRFYSSDTIDQQNFTDLKPISYTQASPVKFHVEAGEGYLIFVPPNLNSEYWELEGRQSIVNGSYAVYPADVGTIYYRRFDTYLLGYAVSLMTLLGLVVWYKKERFAGFLEKSSLFSFH
jgi:hypothetical protein